MKSIVSLCILFISYAAAAQNADDTKIDIPKHASTIYVKHVSFDSIVSELQREGYKIEQQVTNTIIKTKYQFVPGGILKQLSLHIRYADSTAQIMGTAMHSGGSSGPREMIVERNA